MNQGGRKFVGTILVIVSIVVYSAAVVGIYLGALQGAAWWVLIAFFAVAGLIWFFPAALIVRWMSRPD
jgi:RsiW-degrading membrane proteinase PrsW (M82 family)